MMIPTIPAKVGGRPRPDARCIDGAASTDGELLTRFVDKRDEPAFAELLQRHGPMVLGVCRRALRNEADVEDAFQATFLVLVHKAASVRPRAMVANWLYGVARKTALKARVMSNRRLAKEQEAASRAMAKAPIAEPTWNDLQPVIDQELSALPDKYRAAIVLCDVEGKSLALAARQVGCPLGTIGTRVARGRRILCKRLTRRGVVPAASIVAALLAQNAAQAAVPAGLAVKTAAAAGSILAGTASSTTVISTRVASLTVAVLRALMVARIKIAMAVLVVVSLIAYAGVTWARPAPAGDEPAVVKRRFRTDDERLQDTWVVMSAVVAGRDIPRPQLDAASEWTFAGDCITVTPTGASLGSYRLDEIEQPKLIDIDFSPTAAMWGLPGQRVAGIYKFEKRLLTICLADAATPSARRPTEFTSRAGDHPTSLIVLQRKRTVREPRGS